MPEILARVFEVERNIAAARTLVKVPGLVDVLLRPADQTLSVFERIELKVAVEVNIYENVFTRIELLLLFQVVIVSLAAAQH